MHILVFETDSHRQRQLTEEGCAFLETYGEVEIIRQADRQDKEAFAQFLERVPVADGIVIGPWHRPATTPQDWQSACTAIFLSAATLEGHAAAPPLHTPAPP